VLFDNIVNNRVDNLGGSIRLWILPVDAVDEEPPIVQGVCEDAYILHSGWAWTMVEGTRETIAAENDIELNDNGAIYIPKISVIVPGDDATYADTFAQWVEKRWLVIREEHNQQNKLSGRVETPLRFSYKLISPAEFGQRRCYLLTWQATSDGPETLFVPVFTYSPGLAVPPTYPSGYTDEKAQDAAAAMIVAGDHVGINVTYDDAHDKLNIEVDDEYVEDLVGALIQDSDSIDATYNDAGGIESLELKLSTNPASSGKKLATVTIETTSSKGLKVEVDSSVAEVLVIKSIFGGF